MHATCCNIWNYLVATFSNYWLQIFWNSVQSVKCWCEGGRSRAVAVAKIFWSLFKFFSSLIRPHLHISSYLFSFILMTGRHWRGWWSFGPSWNVDIQLSLSGLRVSEIIWFLSNICCSLFLVYGRAHPADWCQTRWCWLALQRRVVQIGANCKRHTFQRRSATGVRGLQFASLCSLRSCTRIALRIIMHRTMQHCQTPCCWLGRKLWCTICKYPPTTAFKPDVYHPFVMCEPMFSLPPPQVNIEHLVYLAKSNQCMCVLLNHHQHISTWRYGLPPARKRNCS